jgi:acetyl-CoA carboxylase carboxyl transferase subunit alpha
LKKLGVVDTVVAEPLGGAHRRPEEAVRAVGAKIEAALRELMAFDGGVLRARRREKFLEMGQKGLS